MSNQSCKIWSFLLAFLVLNLFAIGSGQDGSNIETSHVVEPAVAASPDVAAAPAVAPEPVAKSAPVASAPIPPVAAAPVQAPAIAPTDQGLFGTTTEHKSPDGSTITVTNFKGQLPSNAFHQHYPQMFSPMGNPFFGSPLYPAWGSQLGYRTKRSSKDSKDNTKTADNNANENESTVKKTKSHLKSHPRVSDKFHYPAPPNEYFTTYKKPFVPVVDNEFSDLI